MNKTVDEIYRDLYGDMLDDSDYYVDFVKRIKDKNSWRVHIKQINTNKNYPETYVRKCYIVNNNFFANRLNAWKRDRPIYMNMKRELQKCQKDLNYCDEF